MLYYLIMFNSREKKMSTLVHTQNTTFFTAADASKAPQKANMPQTELDVLLEQFGLTKETLTETSLKKAYRQGARKMHPDKTRLNDNQSFQEMTRQFDALNIFLIAEKSAEYHTSRIIQEDIVRFFSKITDESDRTFLLQTLEATLGAELDKLHATQPGFADATKKLLVLTRELHQSKQLSLEGALDVMSRTASLMKNPEEHRAFFAVAKNYGLVAKGQLSAWIMVVAGWAAKIMTLGFLGDAWIKLGTQKLEQIKIVEEMTAESASRETNTPT